ncbi:MAG: signal peptidase I, partial [Planctomycetes bacterium]|nr:signal peptidase I [Planctomycetota bacterium]
MELYRRWPTLALGALFLVCLAAGWVVFAPTSLGGQVAYVSLTGNSMVPGFRLGDLVVVRQAKSYAIGDRVAYRHPEIGTIFHRIIGKEHERFIFKGDHNDWIDSYTPVFSELIGVYWFHIPRLGGIIQILRKPLNFSLLVAALGLIVIFPLFKPNSPKRQRLRRASPSENPHQSAKGLGNIKDSLFVILIIFFLASLALAAYAFTKPALVPVTEDVYYNIQGTFSYTAPGDPKVYDAVDVQTGEPVFRKLTNKVNIRYNYNLASTETAHVTGVSKMMVELMDVNGWKRLLELQPPTAFTGPTTTISTTLDLNHLQDLIMYMEETSGLKRLEYTVRLIPEVTISGTVVGQKINNTFRPTLEFGLDELQFQLLPGTDQKPNSPTQKTEGKVQTSSLQPNTLNILWLTLVVERARRVAMAGLVISGIGLIALWLVVLRVVATGEFNRIQVSYAPLLANVRPAMLGMALSDKIVDVEDMESLVKLAEKENRLVLYEHTNDLHAYYVQDVGITYRYTFRENASGIPPGLPVAEAMLRWAIMRQEFDVFYQPIFSSDQHQIVAVEALARRRDAKQGWIPAGDFLTLAEETGLIGEISEIVLRKACAQIHIWRQQGSPGIQISVNVSPQQIQHPGFLDKLRRILLETDLPAEAVRLELRDEQIASHLDEMLPVLDSLAASGIHISIDFSGALSISELKRIPAHFVKLEPGSVSDLETLGDEGHEGSMARNIISLAHSLNKQVIASRVENETHLALLAANGCDNIQGYRFGAPMPAEELTQML